MGSGSVERCLNTAVFVGRAEEKHYCAMLFLITACEHKVVWTASVFTKISMIFCSSHVYTADDESL